MLKRARLLLVLLCCASLIGCQQADKTGKKGVPVEAETMNKKETAKKEEPADPKLSFVGEEIIKEPEGALFKKHIGDKEFGSNDEYAAAQEEAVKEYIQNIKKEDTKDWDAEKWAHSIVTALRTNHEKTVKPMQDFEVKYAEVKLPDGRLLQDVSEEELNEEPDPVNVAVLVDASGSMKANVSGGNKMELAKTSLRDFSASLPDNVNISLSVFGHKGTGSDQDKALSCSSIETVYSMQPYDQQGFSEAMNKFSASGWTPLAAAIESAEKELLESSDDKTKTFMYVISDGIETCEGDPVKAAKQAKSSIKNLQINIIGFDVDDEADRQLKEVASAGGGEYTSAKNKQQLDDLISKNWKEAMSKTTWRFWVAGNHNNLNWTAVGMSNELRSLQNTNIQSRNRELDRFNKALNMLLEEDIVELTPKFEISDLIYKRANEVKEYSDSIQSAKHKEIYDTLDRLREIIDKTTKDLDL